MADIEIRKKIDDVMVSLGMAASKIDVPSQIKAFRDKMTAGLKGKGPLCMVPTYIGEIGKIWNGRPVVVLDIGGTNLRRAVVTFSPGAGAAISDYASAPMPGVEREVTSDEFFSSIADMLEPVAGRSDVVSVCFSFGTVPQKNRDAKIFEVGKELKAEGLIGCNVGECIQRELNRRGYVQKKFFVLNDSVAVLLGGMALQAGKEYDAYIGFVLGTGTNLCYYEQTRNILKIGSETGKGQMIVDIESGAFDGFPRSEADLAMDAKLRDAGKWQMEKMVSGRYQGNLFLEMLRLAASRGLFSDKFSSGLQKFDNIESAEIDAFLDSPGGAGRLAKCCSNDATSHDREIIFHLIDNLAERSARMLTVSLGATLAEAGRGTHLPICIVTEGTTLFRSRLLFDKLRQNMKTFVADGMGISYEFVKAEQSTLIGSAIASFAE